MYTYPRRRIVWNLSVAFWLGRLVKEEQGIQANNQRREAHGAKIRESKGREGRADTVALRSSGCQSR